MVGTGSNACRIVFAAILDAVSMFCLSRMIAFCRSVNFALEVMVLIIWL